MKEMFKVRRGFSLFSCKELAFLFFFVFCSIALSFGQEKEQLDFILDINSNASSLPKIFKPNIDLSGRGFHRDNTWPQNIARKEVLDIWQREMGFSGGIYRIQYNLWEMSQLAKDKNAQEKLLSNYEGVIKNISDEGGIVILSIFGTPAGLGKVLDKKSPPFKLKDFKESIKNTIRELSCNKKYNIWYEVWNAPDLDDFFLGRQQDYLNLYRAVAEAIEELRQEYKLYIPVGGPSVSWWFQNTEGNSVITPERSLIYELIKLCYRYHLPLDFVSWHSYSTDPRVENDTTVYGKTSVTLIRDWLSYFNFDRNTPLIIDEWNFDKNANVLPERQEKSFIAASYIPARVNSMYKSGINYQLYFSLEDFYNVKDGVIRNVGIFSFNPESSDYKGSPKASFYALKMLSMLGDQFFSSKLNDEFAGVIATKSKEGFAVLIYNYSDPQMPLNYISRNISILSGSERKSLLRMIKNDILEEVLDEKLAINKIRSTGRVKELFKKAKQLNDSFKKFSSSPRKFSLKIKNLNGSYAYQRYVLDSNYSAEKFKFVPVEEKTTSAGDFQQDLSLDPYSIHLIVLKKIPEESQNPPPAEEPSQSKPSDKELKIEAAPKQGKTDEGKK